MNLTYYPEISLYLPFAYMNIPQGSSDQVHSNDSVGIGLCELANYFKKQVGRRNNNLRETYDDLRDSRVTGDCLIYHKQTVSAILKLLPNRS